jgi:hypothetical protein
MSRKPAASRRVGLAVLFGCAAVGMADTASSAAIQWTDWTSVSIPNSNAAGTLSGIGVTFAGPNDGGSTTGTFNWGPQATYVGGVVGNAPCSGTTACMGDIINLTGATPPATETLTFSSPVTNPVFAVWSLGSSGAPANLTFPAGTAPAIQSSGTNGVFGFVSLTASGNVVSGREGNGTFLLPGTYTSIPFTASFENFYGFTVGMAGPISAAVPEPGMLTLLAAGLVAGGFVARRRSGAAAKG